MRHLFINQDVIHHVLELRNGSLQTNAFSQISSGILITKADHPRLHFLALCMLEEAENNQDDTLFMLYTLALNAQLQNTPHKRKKEPSSQYALWGLHPALNHINNAYMQPCNVEKLANLCHLSETHFRRQFISVMGITPLQYIIQIRIRHACILLGTTNKSVTAIAELVGISSISSFNRNFHQVMGVSPQQYRSTVKYAAF